MVERLRARQEWQFFAALPRADPRSPPPGGSCWCSAARCPPFSRWRPADDPRRQRGPVTGPLAFVGVVFVLMLVVGPILTAVSMNLGNLLSAC